MPAASPATFEEGKTLFDNRRYDDAAEKFRQAILQDPSCPGAHYYLGRSLLEKQLQDEAAGEFCEAIRTNPSDGNARYWLAEVLLEKGSVADAVTLLFEAMHLEPGLLHHFTGRILATLKNQCTFAETEDFFKKSLVILSAIPAPAAGSSDLLLSRGHLAASLGELYFSKGLLNGAMLQYREAVRICPKVPLFHAKLADIYFITNNDEDSVAEYRAALAHDAENAEVHKRLGDALVKTRQFMDAFNEYREVVRLQPENEFYRKVYSQFRALFIEGGEGPAGSPARKPVLHPGGTPSIADEAFLALISGGENEFVEFKSRALWSKSLTKKEIEASDSKDVHKFGRDTSKVILAKTIAGFLNSEGGNLVIGIREHKGGSPNEIIGIENEYPQLKDRGTDGYRRMLIDEVIRKFLPPEVFHHLSSYLRIHFMKVEEHTLCWLEIKKADDAVFVKVQGDEFFFIRVDAETRQLADKGLVDYVRKHFP
jgi:tetratricopeptide (TPR) repeat protein